MAWRVSRGRDVEAATIQPRPEALTAQNASRRRAASHRRHDRWAESAIWSTPLEIGPQTGSYDEMERPDARWPALKGGTCADCRKGRKLVVDRVTAKMRSASFETGKIVAETSKASLTL